MTLDSEQRETIDNLGGLTPGRIVHYVLETYHHRAAMVINVLDGVKEVVNLLVFCDPTTDNRTAVLELVLNCSFSRDPLPGTWHWVEGSFTHNAHNALLERLRTVTTPAKEKP
jgi:hypothetical protein